LAITAKFATENEYVLTDDADEELTRIFERARRGEGFGNARFARTIFEQALNAQALRLADVAGPVLAELEPAALMTLTGEDVHAAAKALGEDGPGQRRRRFLARE